MSRAFKSEYAGVDIESASGAIQNHTNSSSVTDCGCSSATCTSSASGSTTATVLSIMIISLIFIVAIILVVAMQKKQGRSSRRVGEDTSQAKRTKLAERADAIELSLLTWQWSASECETPPPHIILPGEQTYGNSFNASEQEESSDTECAICLSEFAENDEVCRARNVDCKHIYHSKCLKAWLLKHDGCPICRQDYLSSAV
jgi:hypothetical protein